MSDGTARWFRLGWVGCFVVCTACVSSTGAVAAGPSGMASVPNRSPSERDNVDLGPPTNYPSEDEWQLWGDGEVYKGALSSSPGIDVAAASLRSTRRSVRGSARWATGVDAQPYLGTRVVLRATVQSERVRRWGSVWIRVVRDGHNTAFEAVVVQGNTHEEPLEIEVEVPPDADSIRYGLLLNGGGQVSVRGLQLVSVGAHSE